LLTVKWAVFSKVEKWEKARNVALLTNGRYRWARRVPTAVDKLVGDAN
jgi:hypothetical protein